MFTKLQMQTFITEEEFLDYVINRVGLKGYSDYKSRFKKIHSYFINHEFNREQCERFLTGICNEGKSNSTANNLLKIIKHICKILRERDGFDLKKIESIEKIPYKDKTRLKDIDTLTTQEIKKLAEVRVPFFQKNIRVKKSVEIKWNYRMSVAIYIIALGLRIGELCDLQWDDVKNDRIIIRSGKTRESARSIYLPSKFFTKIMKLEKFEHNYVFGSRTGKMNQQTFNSNLKRRLELCGIKKNITSHNFRHSFITQSIEDGCSLAYVAEHVGHTDWSTTAQYTHLTLKHTKTVVESNALFRSNKVDELKLSINNKLNQIHDKEKLKAIYALLK